MELLNNIMIFRLKYKSWLTIMLLMICQTVCGQFVYDRSNMTIGKIDSNGYVYNRSNMTIGRIKSDGYIMDRSNMTIGRAKGIPITYTAVYFFFNKFGY